MECVYSLVFLLLPLKAPDACFRGDQRQVTSVQGTHTTMLIRSAGAWMLFRDTLGYTHGEGARWRGFRGPRCAEASPDQAAVQRRGGANAECAEGTKVLLRWCLLSSGRLSPLEAAPPAAVA